MLKSWKSLGALQKMFSRTGMAVLQSKSQLAVSSLAVSVKASMLQLTIVEEISNFFGF